jgi:amino acid permease
MLTAKELEFIKYWEAHRTEQNSFVSKLLRGFPMALMFGLPIILFILAVYIWFPAWYTKISDTTSGSFITIVIAVSIAIIFFAYFRMHFKWEMNEQLYMELKHKQKKQDAAILKEIHS